MADLFGDDQDAYWQERLNRRQLLPDREFYRELLAFTLNAGPMGVTMRALVNEGIKNGWWQDTASKHFGEKMRAAWAFGLVVVNEAPGISGGTGDKRVIHPSYFTITFERPFMQRRWDALMETLPLMLKGDENDRD